MLAIFLQTTREESIREWLIAGGTIGAAVVALALGLLVPWLRACWLRPTLTIEYESREPCCRDAPFPSGEPAHWVRVKVTNKGRSAAKRCKGKLIAVHRADGSLREDIDPMQLRWAGIPWQRGLEPLDLAREEGEFLGVVYARGTRPDVAFTTVDEAPAGFLKWLEAGPPHRVTLAVYADNAKSETADFVITYGGDVRSLRMQRL